MSAKTETPKKAHLRLTRQEQLAKERARTRKLNQDLNCALRARRRTLRHADEDARGIVITV